MTNYLKNNGINSLISEYSESKTIFTNPSFNPNKSPYYNSKHNYVHKLCTNILLFWYIMCNGMLYYSIFSFTFYAI